MGVMSVGPFHGLFHRCGEEEEALGSTLTEEVVEVEMSLGGKRKGTLVMTAALMALEGAHCHLGTYKDLLDSARLL